MGKLFHSFFLSLQKKCESMLVIISLLLHRKRSSGTSTSLARLLVALFQSLKNFTAQAVALVVFTIFIPFERTESSSMETNENRSPATLKLVLLVYLWMAVK